VTLVTLKNIFFQGGDGYEVKWPIMGRGAQQVTEASSQITAPFILRYNYALSTHFTIQYSKQYI